MPQDRDMFVADAQHLLSPKTADMLIDACLLANLSDAIDRLDNCLETERVRTEEERLAIMYDIHGKYTQMEFDF